jgi:hypothetical protein
MALKIKFQDKDGNQGDYVNIDPKLGEKTRNLVKITLLLNFWKDKATRDTDGAVPYNDQLKGTRTERIIGFDCIEEFNYDLANTRNPYEQSYDYLKTLPKFKQEENIAIDC